MKGFRGNGMCKARGSTVLSLTLSTEEVVELSGYVQKNKQMESLNQMGFRCWVNGAGRVIVIRSDVETRELTDEERHREEPNFDY